MRGGSALALVALLLASDLAAAPRRNLPDGWSWPPTASTRRRGRLCRAELTLLGVRHRAAPRRRLIATPVLVPDMRFGGLVVEPTFRKPPFVMDCRLARALALSAPRLAALGVRALRFSSIHDVRAVRGRGAKNNLSRHALGLAIDVFEVELGDGTRLSVDRHYWSLAATIALAALALRESGQFRAVIDPYADGDSHADHIHLEAKVESAPPPPRKRRRRP